MISMDMDWAAAVSGTALSCIYLAASSVVRSFYLAIMAVVTSRI